MQGAGSEPRKRRGVPAASEEEGRRALAETQTIVGGRELLFTLAERPAREKTGRPFFSARRGAAGRPRSFPRSCTSAKINKRGGGHTPPARDKKGLARGGRHCTP